MQSSKISKEVLKQAQDYTRNIIVGLNASPSHFHAVDYCKTMLQNAGFQEIKEVDKWNLAPSAGYYFTRNGSTLCAFLTGQKCGQKEDPLKSFKVVGCHTDSPCLKIAPVSKNNGFGLNLLNVMTYGGGLWRTWFDRDLTLAGKVIIKNGEKTSFEQS